MQFTNEEAQHLIRGPKNLAGQQQELRIDMAEDSQEFEMHSASDKKLIFQLNIHQKYIFTAYLTCHFRKETVQLLRVDLGGAYHRNPVQFTDEVPAWLHPFAGLIIPARTAHIHVYVRGYAMLDWAVPLQDYLGTLGNPLQYPLSLPTAADADQKKRTLTEIHQTLAIIQPVHFSDMLPV